MKQLFILLLLISCSLNAFSNQVDENLKEEEKIIYSEYDKLRGQIDSFTSDEKGFLLSKASSYAEDAYSDAATNSKYSFFRNSEGTIAFSEDSDGKTLIDFSFLTVAPIKQTPDLVHTIFTQLSAMSVEQFQDRRIGANIGLGYRNYNAEQNLVLGINSFYDYEFSSDHYRIGLGGELKKGLLDLNFNYYEGLSGTKEIKIDNIKGNEKALDGFDIEAGHPFPFLPWTRVFVAYSKFDGHLGEDPTSMRYSSELYLNSNLVAEAGYNDDRQQDGIDQNYWFVKVSITSTKSNQPTLFGPEGQAYSNQIFGTRDVKSTLLQKVRRQNKITVERSQSGTFQVGGN
tara:strand:+ start:1146 stop:2174 length:1029 start_codon:yes stop_codon:yes gene_type:complete